MERVVNKHSIPTVMQSIAEAPSVSNVFVNLGKAIAAGKLLELEARPASIPVN